MLNFGKNTLKSGNIMTTYLLAHIWPTKNLQTALLWIPHGLRRWPDVLIDQEVVMHFGDIPNCLFLSSRLPLNDTRNGLCQIKILRVRCPRRWLEFGIMFLELTEHDSSHIRWSIFFHNISICISEDIYHVILMFRPSVALMDCSSTTTDFTNGH